MTEQPTRRNAELALMLLAFAVGAFAVLQVSLNTSSTLPEGFWAYLAVLAGGFLCAHLVVRQSARYADPFILPVVVLLNTLGLAMIFRLDSRVAAKALANGTTPPTPVAESQIQWVVIGLILFSAVLLILRDHRKLENYTYISGLIGLVLIVLPLIPGLGTTINGATLWIRVGPFSLQPAEIAKIFLSIFFAGYLVRKREALTLIRRKVIGLGVPRLRDLGPIVTVWALCLLVLVVFQRDLGTALLFFGLFVALLFVATQRRSWLIIGGALVAAGGTLGYLLFGHVRIRVRIWADPFAYANDQGYQLVQSIYGFAHGGLLGTGWGHGFPYLVPFAYSDFIFSALGEELGLVGLAGILCLFAIVIQRGFRAAIGSRDPFGSLLATALSVVLALQTFVVLGGVTGLIPLTGLTTPFLSAGGSSLVANYMIVALLMRISDRARQPDPGVPQPIPEAHTEVVSRP